MKLFSKIILPSELLQVRASNIIVIASVAVNAQVPGVTYPGR